MSDLARADFASRISERIIAENRDLAVRWLERLSQLLPVNPDQIFPTTSLLDHIPELIVRIGVDLSTADGDNLAGNAAVLAKAQELGALRHSQHASVHQILHEYELLGGILVAFVKEEMVSLGLRPEPVECLELVNRIRNAVGLLLRATVDAFLSQYLDTISVQGRNLESFHRTLSHELRQPLTTVQGAVQLLQTYPAARTGEKLDHTLETLARNIERIIHITRQLERLARAETERDNPSTQVVNLSHVATDVARQLREMAEARGVVVRIAPDLPSITVDAGRIELVFTNLISNAIKYSDPAKEQRVVEVRRAEAPEDVCAITVSDNGIGIPADRVDRIFDQFVRAHRGRDEELGVHGMGLGLSIVWESVMAIGGSITVASAESEGTVFTVMLPNECLA